jgi:hypothetical protein
VVIPASKRPDGSMRKPIRIRKGYVPQDEVPKYKTIAQRVSCIYQKLSRDCISKITSFIM